VAGHETISGTDVATVWNGTDSTASPLRLTGGTTDSAVLALAVHEGSLYAAGSEDNGTTNVAKIWKLTGGAVTETVPLSDGTNSGVAYALLPVWE
jgi:hypothetical protein